MFDFSNFYLRRLLRLNIGYITNSRFGRQQGDSVVFKGVANGGNNAHSCDRNTILGLIFVCVPQYNLLKLKWI